MSESGAGGDSADGGGAGRQDGVVLRAGARLPAARREPRGGAQHSRTAARVDPHAGGTRVEGGHARLALLNYF